MKLTLKTVTRRKKALRVVSLMTLQKVLGIMMLKVNQAVNLPVHPVIHQALRQKIQPIRLIQQVVAIVIKARVPLRQLNAEFLSSSFSNHIN